jgi:four helix bundle protein
VKTSIVKDKSYHFALAIIRLGRSLREKKEYEIATQLLRAGTGIGANVEEALAGVSRADFSAKMAIASKEARETHYWLRLLRDSKTLSAESIGPLLKEAEDLIRILTAIVKTSRTPTLTQNLKLKTKN